MEIIQDFSDKSFHFPEEILLEILVKLPVNSVFRFKCVSKNWFSLISDPTFFPYYLSLSKDSPPFVLIFQADRMHSFLSTSKTLKNFTFLFPSDQIPGLKVEATSSDLILYRSNGQSFVANPFTRKSVALPIHSTRRSYGSPGLVSYVKNGTTGFNVARLMKNCDNSLNLETFSSERGEWRNFSLTNQTFNNVEVDTRPCVLYNGAVHWICNKMTALLAYDPCSTFDDQCRFISIPNGAYNMNGKNAILGVSGGNLYYFEMNRISIHGSKLPGWKLWVLKDYERGEWSLDHEGKEMKIELISGVLCNLLLTYSPLLPVAFHPWDRNMVYFWYEGYILTFNVKRGWFEDKFLIFSSESMVSTLEIFPLLMPFCPTQLFEHGIVN